MKKSYDRASALDRRAAVPRTLGGDPEQEYFADGITDDLTTTDLSHLPDSFVIARNIGLHVQEQGRRPAKQIGRELGVRYLLEGSVRRGSAIRSWSTRSSSQPKTGAHVWADRFDGERSKLG